MLFTCLDYGNRCRSFKGSDGRIYQNELTLDNHLENQSCTAQALVNFDYQGTDKILKDLWNQTEIEIKKCQEYNPQYRYGIYQIDKELNTYREEINLKGDKKRIYDYPVLNGILMQIKQALKEKWKELEPILFKYEFLK